MLEPVDTLIVEQVMESIGLAGDEALFILLNCKARLEEAQRMPPIALRRKLEEVAIAIRDQERLEPSPEQRLPGQAKVMGSTTEDLAQACIEVSCWGL